MQKAEPQHGHTQQHQPAAKQAKAASVESPQGEHIAQLEAVMDSSPQAEKLGGLAAMMNNSPAMAAQRKLADMMHNSPRQAAQRKLFDAIHNSPHQIAQKKKFDSLFGVTQRVIEEEPVQHKLATEEEPLQGKFDAAQRVAEEEPIQHKLASDTSAQLAPAEKRPNNTGLPDNLKSGIENLSGMSMDNVKVHYNSSQPAQLNALAYAQGTDIHVAPGQEQHLPHEAWHVVQQAQGRVQPTMQMKEGIPVNDDKGLEHEADVMGGRAVQMRSLIPAANFINTRPMGRPSVQFNMLFRLNPSDGTIQRVIHLNAEDKDISVLQAMEALTPLIRFKELDRETLGYIADLLDEYDEDDRAFNDIADLAVSLDFDVRAEDPELAGILIDDKSAEIILDPVYQKMIQGVDLPPLKQQILAKSIKAEAETMAAVYERMGELVNGRKHSPEKILKWFTEKTRDFSLNIIKAAKAAFGLPSAPLSIMMAGSGARQEMFPGSDLDLAAVTETGRQEDVIEIFDFMQKVEKILQLTVGVISKARGSNGEIGLGPDTGVFGFRNSPELLAEKTLGMNNTGQDASLLANTASAKEQKIAPRFFDSRNKLATEKHGLSSLREILGEFHPPTLGGRMNIKTQFLRLPTLAFRDLSQVFNLKSVNSFDRIRELHTIGYIDSGLASNLLQALNNISGIRLQCHVHYGKEEDTFAILDSDKVSQGDYVLTPEEVKSLAFAAEVLKELHSRLRAFCKKRADMAWGAFTTKSI